MNSAQDQMKFKDKLMQDVAAAQETASQSAVSRGAPEDTDFAPRAVVVGKRAMGQRELEENKSAVENVIQELTRSSGLVDEVEVAQFQNDMRKKMNQYRMMLFKHASEAQKRAAEQGLEDANAQAAWQALGGLAQGVTSGIVSNWKSTPSVPATATGASGVPNVGMTPKPY